MAFKDRYRLGFTDDPRNGFLRIESAFMYGRGMAKKGYPYGVGSNDATHLLKFFKTLTEARAYAYRKVTYGTHLEIVRFYVNDSKYLKCGHVSKYNDVPTKCIWVAHEKGKGQYNYLYSDGSIREIPKGELSWVDEIRRYYV